MRRPAFQDSFSIALYGELLSQKKTWGISLLIIGSGAMRPELEKYVTEHAMIGSVKFIGFVSQPDLPRLYAASDFAVFPSRYQETWARRQRSHGLGQADAH